MAQHLTFFSGIYDFTAKEFVDKMRSISKEDVVIHALSPGGSIFAGWAMISAIHDHEGKVIQRSEGDVSSMMLYCSLFVDKHEALNVTSFTLHRADGYVANEQDQIFLDEKNKELRAALESKVNEEKFTEIFGYTFDDVFNPDKRIDININAKQALEIGLVDEIVRITKEEEANYAKRVVALVGESQGGESQPQGSGKTSTQPKSNKVNNNKKTKTMTKEEFKAANPAAYAEIVAESQGMGEKLERVRVNAFIPFLEADPEAVKKAIKEGDEFNASVQAELLVKLTAKKEVAGAEGESAKKVETPKATTTDEDPEAVAKKKEFEAKAKDLADKIKV